jgi:hypothetical protein
VLTKPPAPGHFRTSDVLTWRTLTALTAAGARSPLPNPLPKSDTLGRGPAVIAPASSPCTSAPALDTRHRPVCGIMWVIFDHLRPPGHIMPDHAGDRGAVFPGSGASRSPPYQPNEDVFAHGGGWMDMRIGRFHRQTPAGWETPFPARVVDRASVGPSPSFACSRGFSRSIARNGVARLRRRAGPSERPGSRLVRQDHIMGGLLCQWAWRR